MCTMSLDLLTKTEISLSKEEYNATKSKIEFQLEAFDEKKWTQMRDSMPLSIVSSFQIDLTIFSLLLVKAVDDFLKKIFWTSGILLG